MWTRGKILICPTCVKIFSNLCKAKRSFQPNMHPYDSEIENRRVIKTGKYYCYNEYFVPPPTHRILPWKLYFTIFRENFPSEMKPGKCSAKKTNKNGQKSEKKGKEKKQKVDIEKAMSLSNKTSWNFSTFAPNFRSCSFAPGTDWSQNSFLIVFSLLILLAWKWPENSCTCLVFYFRQYIILTKISRIKCMV